jgi:hypothetical protein
MKQRVVRDWLTDQAGKGGELEYVCERLEDGDTLVQIAGEIARATQIEIGQHTIRRWLQDQFRNEDVAARFKAARLEGAHADVEKAQEILDSVPEIRDAIAKAKARADFLIWKAGVNNRPTYGPVSAVTVNNNLSVAALHLSALRTRQVQGVIVNPAPVAELLAAGADEEPEGDEQRPAHEDGDQG